MFPLKTLFEFEQRGEPVLSDGLQKLYDGDLFFPPPPAQRPYVFGNFVTTLDGVISYRLPGHSGGGDISGSDPADRFIMGLLRASADAVLVGAASVHDVDAGDLWTPEFVFPEAREVYRQYRVSVLHKSEKPLTVVVSGSGSLDLSRAVFHTPDAQVLVITSPAGRAQLVQAGASALGSVQVRTIESAKTLIDPEPILHLLSSEFGVRAILHEGGPTLFGHFLERRLVDELFLTLAPQIAGRRAPIFRPGMVGAVEFLPASAPWWHLLSCKQGADHLYLRYRISGAAAKRQS